MKVLVDTNILGRLAQPRHALHSVAVAALDALNEAGNELRIVPQVIYEFWAIATRPIAENGLGFSVDDTKERLQRFKTLFPPLRDERGMLEPWEKLVVDYSVKGKPTHDARLVAAMQRTASRTSSRSIWTTSNAIQKSRFWTRHKRPTRDKRRISPRSASST
jgi:hypothetical protein